MHDRSPSSAEAIERRLEETDDAAGRFDLLNQLAMEFLRDDWHRADEVIAEMEGLAKQEGDRRWRGIAMLRRVGYLQLAGDLAGARRVLGMVAGIVRQLGGDPEIEAMLHRSSGVMLITEGRFHEALEELARALELAESIGAIEGVVEVYGWIAVANRFLGRYSDAIDILFKGLRIVSRTGNRQDEARFLNQIAIIYCALEEWENALDYYRRYLAICRDRGNESGEGVALMNIGGVYLSQGKVAEAIETMSAALAIMRRTGARDNVAGLLSSLGKAYGAAGEYDRALRYLEEARGMYDDMKSRSGATLIDLYTGELYTLRKEWEKALEYTLRAMELAREIGHARIECISNRMAAEICEELGDIPRSLHHYKVYFHHFRDLENQNLRHKLTEAERQAERERIERDNDAYRVKIEKLSREMEERQQELMSMALRLVKRDEFIDGIREQATEYARSGKSMPATDLLRRMRVRNDDDQWHHFEGQFNRLYHEWTTVLLRRYHLTPTELKVCMLLRLGIATKEIADTLHMSVHTVETHRRRVRKKLGLPRNGNLATFLTAGDTGYSLPPESGNGATG